MVEQTFIFFLIYFVVYVGANDHLNSSVTCIYSDNAKTCKERNLYFVDNALFGGKCPGCVKRAERGEACKDDLECAPGLNCKKDKCADDSSKLCYKARLEAEAKKAWEPDCLPDGTYAPKQCKGELMSGRCFCSSPEGVRIFGEEYWNNAENMTCACSRMMWNELKTRPSASLHCDDFGNFEELQCDNGVCWCADIFTARPFSIMVPQAMYKSLPCYTRSKHGDQYLRQCDSERVAQANAKEILSIHGTDNIALSLVNCNYDGSYARVQVINNKKQCVRKDKLKLTEYETEMSDMSMTCNCEYDKQMLGENTNLLCAQNGNYMEKQYAGPDTYCVDSDGYPTPCKTIKKSKKNKS